MSNEEQRPELPPGFAPGAILGDAFRVEALLGRGGMGLVLSARDLSSQRRVALKVLPANPTLEPEEAAASARRFEREAEVLRAIRHPGIVEYLRAGLTRDGARLLAMEFLEGETLLARARREPLQVPEVLEIGAQACEALAYAHTKGVVHRDLKPANIFLCQGPRMRVKLIDFGIARFLDDRRRVTRAGGFVGTPAYMAPEQLRGEEQIDGRADLYSLAVTLYEAMSRKLPIEGPDTVSLLLKVLSERPRPIRELRADVPPALERLFTRALAKTPKERYANATEMAEAFRSAGENPGNSPDATRINRPVPRVSPPPSGIEAARPSLSPTPIPSLPIMRSAPPLPPAKIPLPSLPGVRSVTAAPTSHPATNPPTKPPASLPTLPAARPGARSAPPPPITPSGKTPAPSTPSGKLLPPRFPSQPRTGSHPAIPLPKSANPVSPTNPTARAPFENHEVPDAPTPPRSTPAMGMTRAEPPRRPEGTEFSPRGTPALGLKRPDLPEPRFQRTQAATVPQEELRLPKPVFQPNEAEGNPRRPLREAARATLLLSGPEEEPELKTAPGVPHHEETSGEESPSQERLHLDIPTTRQSPLDPAELGLPLDDDADSLATLRPEADFDDEPAPSLRPTTRDRLGAVPPSGDDLLATEIGRQPASLADSFHEETNPKALPQPLYARGQALGELRRVIVVLVAGPARQPVSSVLERAASCLAEAGGLVERRGDGRVTALFGASHSYGDEARRAVRAALCARAPELRVGIGSGRVISSDEGGAVPKAASLLARAEPGEILLSEETFRRVRGLFDVELTHDGVARVLGERLGGVLIGTRSLLGVETPTVGRERELQTLRQALTDSLRGGEARAVLLVGEAGVGKSRLKFESRLLLEELRITPLYLEGAGDPIRAQTPYALLGAALRMLGDIRAGDAPQERLRKLVGLAARLSGQELPRERAEKQASLLATVLGVEILSNAARRTPPQSLRAEIEDLLVGLLSAAARREPVALILEDMQWADAGSLSVLARLVEQPRLKLFLLGIGRSSVLELRPAFFTQAPHQEIRLGALPKEALTALLTTLLGETPPAELLSYLCDATGGNPFLFEELLAALWEKGALAQDANGALVLAKDPASVRVPAEAEALLQSRLDHLPQSEKEALKLGAVFGRLFWEEGLSALGVERARELLDALRSREFIVLRSESRFAGSREYAFRHVLLRDVAYGLLPEVERESLHAKAAAWLESVGERDLVIIARHYELANDEQRAAEHYASAATRAAADYATEAAYAAIERAKALEHRPVLRANLLFLEEDLRFWGGERAKSRELLDELSRIVANLPDAKLRLLLGLREGRLATVSGAFSRGEELLRRVVSDAQQQKDPETELLAITPLARSLNNLGRQDEAIALCRSALAQARILRRPDQLASLLYHIGVGHSQQGELSLSIRYLEESLAASRSAGDQRMEAAAVTSIASTLVNLGCYAEAERYNRDTIALSKRINDAYSAAYGWLNLGNSLTLSARYDEGESALSEAYETAQRFELPWVPDFARGYMARLYAMRNRPGDAQRALALADQALEGSKGRDEQWVAFAHLWRARALLALGDPGRALSAISLALQIRDRLGSMEEGEEDMLLAHFQILSALRRTNEARTAIAVANSFVENRAQRIGDATYRESYLSREVAASAIRAAYLQAKPRI